LGSRWIRGIMCAGDHYWISKVVGCFWRVDWGTSGVERFTPDAPCAMLGMLFVGVGLCIRMHSDMHNCWVRWRVRILLSSRILAPWMHYSTGADILSCSGQNRLCQPNSVSQHVKSSWDLIPYLKTPFILGRSTHR